MITLDGVMQAPGEPEEDTSGGFEYGGWTEPYGDEAYGKAVERELKPAEYLWAEIHLRFGRLTGLNMLTFGQASMMGQNTSGPRRGKSQIGKTRYFSKVWQISKSLKIHKALTFKFGAVANLSSCYLIAYAHEGVQYAGVKTFINENGFRRIRMILLAKPGTMVDEQRFKEWWASQYGTKIIGFGG